MSFDTIPIWGVFVVTSVIITAALEVGFRVGQLWLRRGGTKSDVSGAMVGATMGLLAFMLAFTFNAAASRHEARRALVIEDVNAIEKTWLRADFLNEPSRTEMRRLLREYVDLRVKLGTSEMDVSEALPRSNALQDSMWVIAATAGQTAPGSITGGLLIQSLNGMIDTQLERLTVGTRYRIASVIWFALYALVALGMVMMGIQSGLAGLRQTGIGVALALSFAIVLFLITDLDRPQDGFVNVSQQPMVELQNKMQSGH